MRRNKRQLAFIVTMVIVSCVVLYGGHFFFSSDRDTGQPEKTAPVPMPAEPAIPVVHKHFSQIIKGHRQDFHLLEIDAAHPDVAVKPILSHDSLFGFETLSSMVQRSKAYAAVNGGFFHEFGQPTGIVMIDGELMATGTAWFPALIVQDGKAVLRPVKTDIRLDTPMGGRKLQGMNRRGESGEVIVYTRAYGLTNRVESSNVSLVIAKDKVERVVKKGAKVPIPSEGVVVTAFEPIPAWVSGIEAGDAVRIHYENTPASAPGAQVYECGSWLVREGKLVIGTKDPWVGVMTNRDPRTAVGIKNDGKLVLLTVDGRQPGHSAGLTGKELGEFLQEYGVSNAALLDGGASTEMIVEGKIVNKPSFKGRERPLAGGLIIKWTKGKTD